MPLTNAPILTNSARKCAEARRLRQRPQRLVRLRDDATLRVRGSGLAIVLIGISRAKELSLSGNFLDAQTACAWGLVNRVVTADDLLPAARKLAADIASADPVMVQAYKALIDAGFGLPFDEAMALEHRTSSARNAQVQSGEVEERRKAVMERGRSQAG